MENVFFSNDFNIAVEFLAWIAYERKTAIPAYIESFGFLLGRQAFAKATQEIAKKEGEKAVAKFCSKLQHTEYSVSVFNSPSISKESLFVGLCSEKEQRVLVAAGFNPCALDVENEEIMTALGKGFEAGVFSKKVSDERTDREQLDALIDSTIKEIFG